jgi:sugar lactone lactonase YvrE
MSLLLLATAGAAAAQAPAGDCGDVQECRQLALDARTRGAYETFHDLAWRAVQKGRPNDPDLMYLLARAQALSGRRRDAVVMLRRLAEAGVPNDAATDDDFRRVRELADWQYVAALAGRVRPAAPAVPPASAAVPPVAPASPVTTAVPAAAAAAAPAVDPPLPAKPPTSAPPVTAAATPPKPAAPPAATEIAPPVAAPLPKPIAPPQLKPAAAAPPKPAAAPPKAAAAVAPVPRRTLPVETAAVEDAVRFSTRSFTPGGLAYDAISRRFLFADVTGQRLFVVGEGSDRTVDLVRADSAGFDDVTAIAIDSKRGDLWVASTAADASTAAVHRLQLISGRALTKLVVASQDPVRLTDLAVAGDGSLFILDSSSPRVLVLRPGATRVEPLMRLTTPNPACLTVDESGRQAYVAHREGIARLDLQTRRAFPLDAADGLALTDFDCVRAYGESLIGTQVQADGSRGVVRLQLNRERRAVAAATLLETLSPESGARTEATIVGDDLYYLAIAESPGRATTGTNVRVRRVKLR